MKSHENRYKASAKSLLEYSKKIVVHCPACQKDAMISNETPENHEQAELLCANCLHKEKGAGRLRYKMTLSRNCDNCGKAIEKTVVGLKMPQPQIKAACPHCGSTRNYEPKTEKYIEQYTSDTSITDPVFNLPLRLQTNVKGNVLWAYNKDHLQDIRDYVASGLRERQESSFSTMVEKLPGFIKSAKNREAVLKSIDKLLVK